MKIRLGYELIFNCPQPTPMLLMLTVHYSRMAHLITPDNLITNPELPIHSYRDGFGNVCSRLVAPAGPLVLTTDAVIFDSGAQDIYVPEAREHAVQDLPDEALVYLLASRYCETELLLETAWSQFGHLAPGWSRVQAVCDYVHNHITFGYHNARRTRTAWEAYNERVGVCRDYTHLAITLCRCLNIPARYCTGYLGDIGVPLSADPMDFSAWFEVYLDGRWYTFDARNNKPRIGRVLMATGRDAADVAISTTFGPNLLTGFKVWTDEVVE